MSNQEIPEAAIEAAMGAMLDPANPDLKGALRAALEAAAPHMRTEREKRFDVPAEPDDGLLGWALDNTP